MEIAVFVEYIVARKEALMGEGLHGPVFAPCSGIVEGAAGLIFAAGSGSADNCRHAADFFGDFGEGGFDVADEATFKQQVSGWVATDGEFGEEHELGAFADELLIGVQYELFIAGEVTDGGVDLGETDLHR